MGYIFFFFLFILGLSVGSFLNVLIDRLAKGQKITGRSHCDHCRRKLSYRDLIPVVSFILLKGRCRYCRKKIPWRYPLVELLTGLGFVFILFFFPSPSDRLWNVFVYYFSFFGIFSCLIVIFFQDLKYQIISDEIQIFLFVFILFFHLVNNFRLIPSFFLSAILTMAPILFLHLVTKGRGMGFGDVKLSFLIGFFLGTKSGFLALYLAFVLGGIVGLVLVLTGRKKLKSKIAFGPFLVAATVIAWLIEKGVILT